MSDTPKTDALIKADWHMPRGWKDRIHEHARALERELADARGQVRLLQEENRVLGVNLDNAIAALAAESEGD